ncbi:putative ser thr protein phosphatase family protein [Erysiphe necator]|uniref:Putative ser thr protein phosphatase family protein n=1 Tax=Uncinula necator TaxID=52586 RepID=A0A0B1NX25_UNCNE|nr:putative ser thr protein phosphatase family protein [Erysiphe necator]
MTVMDTNEGSPHSETNSLLLPKYQRLDKESSLDENSSYREEEKCKLPRIRHKHFFFATALLFFWAGYFMFTSEWSFALTGDFIRMSLMPNCHSHNDFDSTSIMDLSPEYLPTSGSEGDNRRLIMIGDIHGMKKELENLLEKIVFNPTRDHVILVGDLIAKGPDSLGVVDLAMRLGATCVRGNHEDQAIQAWDDMQAEEKTTIANGTLAIASKPYDKKHMHLAQSLGKERIDWIKTWPIILRVGGLGSMGEVLVAHAGLDPEVPLEKQDLYMVMNMRSIKHGAYTDKHEGKVWTKKWNKYQNTLKQEMRRTVIYGHDAKRGLRIKNYSLGIDSACFKGHKLTAAIFEVNNYTYSYKLDQVKC